ncbi:hypothetical protein CASFOL_041120 [Castilleja foliolosa]|uniref:Spt5 KOW domain-containing protein n=1 Tax=Castilleja foliolosa TaxID=1961234 RepID=A0ABD3BDW4_9LAMI
MAFGSWAVADSGSAGPQLTSRPLGERNTQRREKYFRRSRLNRTDGAVSKYSFRAVSNLDYLKRAAYSCDEKVMFKDDFLYKNESLKLLSTQNVQPNFDVLEEFSDDNICCHEKELCKYFESGNHIKVVSGAIQGVTDMVVFVVQCE